MLQIVLYRVGESKVRTLVVTDRYQLQKNVQ